MKDITVIIKNLKNLLPYLLLIAIYFFFVNLEARNEKKTNSIKDNEYILIDNESSQKYKHQRIKIPVIPYKQ